MRFARTLPSLLLLAFFLLFAVAPGCGAGPEPPAAEQLRRTFPEQAAAVLERREVFTPTAEGFVSSGADGAPIAGAGLRAALSQRGQDAITLHVPASDFEISVREADASGEGVVAGGAVAYARSHGSSFWAANESGVEEWLMLEAGVARAGHVLASWEIDGGTLRQEGEVISISDAAGVPRIRVTAPAAFGAGGRPVMATLAAHGTTIDLTVDGGGDAVLVDPLWVATTSMSAPRYGATATVLPSGKVLVVGGSTSMVTLASCELYDPATGTWALTGSLATARAQHTAVLLGNGKVLVAGGSALASAELYDPAAGTWTSGGNMTGSRIYHAMALVGPGNSKVLVAGGLYNGMLSAAADLYDPVANTWTAAAPMSVPRRGHTLTLLNTGKVLAAGGGSSAGTSINSAELYTPGANTWAATGALPGAREGQTATLLPSGKVIAVAGFNQFTMMSGQVLATTALYDPVAGTWASGGNLVKFREDHATVLLPNGGVLAIGGSGAEPSVEFYDAAANTWSNAGPLVVGRGYHVAAPLPGGKVLVAGGVSSVYTATAEIYSAYVGGTPCATSGECSSGFCVDGFCCGSACSGLCQGCSAAKTGGVNGTCGNITVATDPDNDCAAQAASTCGTNGACDGAGKCQLYVSGVACLPSSCSGSTLTNASTCNGAGMCVAGGTQSCGAYLCAGASCPTSCTLTTDCTLGNVCVGAKCVAPLLPDGSACMTAGQCNSGNCVDGVCCNTACSAGACDACSVAAGAMKDGVCALLSGNPCDDGDVCTQSDTCSVGACMPGSPVQCAAIDMCHTAGVCDSSMGGCTNPVAADGTSCVDKNGCTQNDTCQSGKCVGGPVCPPSADGCQVGGCNGLGLCDYAPVADGTKCSDGDSCTTNDVCTAGACAPGPKVTCPGIDKCHLDGVCVAATGACTDGGPKAPECTIDPECETLVLACDPATGECSKTTKPDGTPCGGTGECIAGTCSVGTGSASGGSTSAGGTGSGTGSASTGSAGTGSAGTASSGSASTGVGGSASVATSGGGGNSGDGTVSPAGGCGCSTVGTSESRAPWLLLGLLLAAKRRRRRRAA